MKLFYTNYITDEGIDPENPIEVETQYVVNIFLNMVDGKDNFLGLIDNKGNCIQFINEENRWLLDIPNPPNFQNKQAYLNDSECINLIVEIVDNNIIRTDMKLYNVNTMNETLDDVLLQEQNTKKVLIKKEKPFWKFW